MLTIKTSITAFYCLWSFSFQVKSPCFQYLTGINQCRCQHWPLVRIRIRIKRWPEPLSEPGRHPAHSCLPQPCAPATLLLSTSPFFFTWPKPKSTILLSPGVNWQLEQPEFVGFANQNRDKKDMAAASFWQLWQIFRQTLTMDKSCSKLDPLLPHLEATVHFSCLRMDKPDVFISQRKSSEEQVCAFTTFQTEPHKQEPFQW